MATAKIQVTPDNAQDVAHLVLPGCTKNELQCVHIWCILSCLMLDVFT